MSFIRPQPVRYSKAQREEILNLYAPMRVTDVRDGMDWMGFHHYGTMGAEMRPLWPTKAMGFALTVRYVPYNRPVPQGFIGDAYTEWSDWFYKEICPNPWKYDVTDYDMVVIDQCNLSVGVMGSMNSLMNYAWGASGFIVDGGVRDTDELIMEKIPVWSKKRVQPMDQGRIEYVEHNTKISCDNVCVCPGDFVVADGDGVIVVPSDMVYDVAKYAAQEMNNDKPARKYFYIKAGIPLDDSVDVEVDMEEMDRRYKRPGK